MTPIAPSRLAVRRDRKGHGLFAVDRLAEGESLYVTGPVVPIARARWDNLYWFGLDEDHFIDASKNLARFMNHACQPNCAIEPEPERKRVRVYTLREILPGEELTLLYSDEFRAYWIRQCRCATCMAPPQRLSA